MNNTKSQILCIALHKKSTIHQVTTLVTTMLATAKMSSFNQSAVVVEW